jgi:predicted LPLAT superfamily acyltransferase
VVVVWILRRLGDAPLQILSAPIALYYYLFAGKARRASIAYQTRLNAFRGSASKPGPLDIYRHFYSFAEVIRDRFSLWSGAIDDFQVAVHGRENMASFVENKRGAFLVGAHIGSFDVLRVIAREADIPINVLLFTGNAERINDTFKALDPTSNLRVIQLDPGSAHGSFQIRRCLERGEFVAVLGDRVRPGGRNRVTYVDFLGEPAPFPQGPFLLPMILRVPVVLTFALRSGPRSYDIFLETLASDDPVPRGAREAVLRERIQKFAGRLEHHCMQAPLQWFNFYDFWVEADVAQR